MSEEIKKPETEEELTEMEVAELANKLVRERDAEIAGLKKELARAKLLSKAPAETDEVPMSEEECKKVLSDSRSTNYDIIKAAYELDCRDREAGRPSSFGEDADEINAFFKGVLDEADGDKRSFTSIYQARLAPDDAKIAMAYNKRNKR